MNPEIVARILREAWSETVEPYFCQLSDGDIREKRPGNIVTAADEAAEAFLIRRLEAYWPGSRALGEESIERGEASRDAVFGKGRFWCIDPIDGTRAFAAGNPRFTMLISAFQDGVCIAAWNFAPVENRLAMAEAGAGLRYQGMPASRVRAERLHEARVVANRGGLNRDKGQGFRALVPAVEQLTISMGFGMDFLDLVAGHVDAVLFSSISPWEYPCGRLLTAELGGAGFDYDARDLPEQPRSQSLFFAGQHRPLLDAAHQVVRRAYENA